MRRWFSSCTPSSPILGKCCLRKLYGCGRGWRDAALGRRCQPGQMRSEGAPWVEGRAAAWRERRPGAGSDVPLRPFQTGRIWEISPGRRTRRPKMRSRVCASVCPPKSGCPRSSSPRTHPTAQQSIAGPYSSVPCARARPLGTRGLARSQRRGAEAQRGGKQRRRKKQQSERERDAPAAAPERDTTG